MVDPFAPRGEHPRCLRGGGLDQVALLLLAAPAKPVRGRAALLVAALDEPGSDLRGNDLLALEHSQRVAAETDEQHRHAAIGSESGEQRLDHDVLVLAFVVEPERRRDGERLTFQLEPRAPIPVDGPSRRALERCEPLGEVGAADVAHC